MAVSIHIKRVTKPFMASVADIRTYVYGAAYDSWNHVQTMTYPDGEVVTNRYNAVYVVKQKCTTANVVIYSDISLFYYKNSFVD